MTGPLQLPEPPPVASTLRPVRRWIGVTLLALGLGLLVASAPISIQRYFQWYAIGTPDGVVTYEGTDSPGSTVVVVRPRTRPDVTLAVPADGRWAYDLRADDPAEWIVTEHGRDPARDFVDGHDRAPTRILLLPGAALLVLLSRVLIPITERWRHRRLMRTRTAAVGPTLA